ncbi:MAG: TonB-dependent receptor [Bacteroidales bacterium]|nr:TonB-dependent receptor [Bacteroidales bacterium]
MRFALIFIQLFHGRIAGIIWLALTLLLSGQSVGIYGQSPGKRVTGVVKDATDGSLLPGVTVFVQGTTRGTATNVNGEFSIDVGPQETLVFSFVGKKQVEIIPGTRNVIELELYDDTAQFEEVVVTAFGKQKKSNLVASIETVKVSDLKIASSNLTTALAGKISGVISYQTTGEPGADNAEFFVRGVTTFGDAGRVSPLILIDGFEATSNDLARLNPDDIESFSVMKDASATVMYGARSANGIISVVTKSGREGPARVSARLDVQIAVPTQTPKFLDGVEYMRLYNEASIARTPEDGLPYSEQKILSTQRNENSMLYPNINWYNELFNKTTMNTRANVNVSGGGKVASYFVAVGYEKENGLLKVDKLNNFNNNISINRVNIRTNVTFNLTSTTKLDTRINGRFERYNGPNKTATGIWNDIMNTSPVDFPFVYEPDEEHQGADYILFGSTLLSNNAVALNPYAEMVRGFENRYENTVIAMATLMQDLNFITPGLNFQFKASISNHGQNSTRRSYAPRYFGLENYNQITGEYKLYALEPNVGFPYLGTPSVAKESDTQYYYEAIFNWSNSFNRHNLGGTIVGIMQENLLYPNSMSVRGFELMPERNLGISGRFTYNFDNRYFADFSFGYNGSEKFTGSKQFGFFPAFGLAWSASNEKFWAPVKDIVSGLKLKATIGTGGNDAITDRDKRFGFLSQISGGPTYNFGETMSTGYTSYLITRYANPDITWELSTKYNLGTEVSFFKNEIVKLQADVFRENRRNVYLVRENIPRSAGFESSGGNIQGNTGEIKSRGFDGSIDIQHSFSQDFWITGRGTFTYTDNELVALDEKEYKDNRHLSRIGRNYNQQSGLVAERLFVDELEIANSPEQWQPVMAGDIKYKDINGDGVVNENDRVYMGYPTVPQMQYGFGFSMGYKRFDFSVFFQGNALVSFFINPGVGTDASGTAQGIAPFATTGRGKRNALQMVARDHWSETNRDVHAFYPRLSVEPINNNTQQSSWWLRDGSFMRLKSLEIGYRLPGLDKIGLETCRIYFSGENLLALSPFKLWDPEMGRNGLKYPPNKRFNIGIHLNF